jgi:hypothetical protein
MEQYTPEIPTDLVDLIIRGLDERIVMNLAVLSKSLNKSICTIREDWSYWRDKLEKRIKRNLHGYDNKDITFWVNRYVTYLNRPSLSVFLHYGNLEEMKLYLWIEDIRCPDVKRTVHRAIRHYIRGGNILALRSIISLTPDNHLMYEAKLINDTVFTSMVINNNYLDIVKHYLVSSSVAGDELNDAVTFLELCIDLNNPTIAQYLIETHVSRINIYDPNGDVVYGHFLNKALEGPPEILKMLVKYPNLEWEYLVETAIEKKLYESLEILLEEAYTTYYVDDSLLDDRIVEIFKKHGKY